MTTSVYSHIAGILQDFVNISGKKIDQAEDLKALFQKFSEHKSKDACQERLNTMDTERSKAYLVQS